MRDPPRVVWDLPDHALRRRDRVSYSACAKACLRSLHDPPSDSITPLRYPEPPGAVEIHRPRWTSAVVSGFRRTGTCLIEVVLEAGGPHFQVDKAEELDESWFEGACARPPPPAHPFPKSRARRHRMAQNADSHVEVARTETDRRPALPADRRRPEEGRQVPACSRVPASPGSDHTS